MQLKYWYGPRQANLVLIAYASSEGSDEPAHPRSLARTFAARSYKQWIKRNLQTESQIPGLCKWLGMRSWNLLWRNARRHKFAWRGSYRPTLHSKKCMTCSQILLTCDPQNFQGRIPFKFLQFPISSRWQSRKMALTSLNVWTASHPLRQMSLYISRHWPLGQILEVAISLACWKVSLRWECRQIRTTVWIVWIWF